MVYLKDNDEIKTLKQSGSILSYILKRLSIEAKPGVKLNYLNNLAMSLAKSKDASLTFYGYKPEGATKAFPAGICTSINDKVVHGVPNNYIIKNGDLLKIDAGITYKDMITDSATTIMVGNVSKDAKRLVSSTRNALKDGIKEAVPGNRLGDIGFAISRRAKKDGFFVLKELTGHGVGFELHEDPVIFNFGKRNEGIKLKKGMVIAIEPMFSTTSEYIIQNKDESYSSVGKGLTAHFEDTVAITKNGNIVLTQ